MGPDTDLHFDYLYPCRFCDRTFTTTIGRWNHENGKRHAAALSANPDTPHPAPIRTPKA